MYLPRPINEAAGFDCGVSVECQETRRFHADPAMDGAPGCRAGRPARVGAGDSRQYQRNRPGPERGHSRRCRENYEYRHESDPSGRHQHQGLLRGRPPQRGHLLDSHRAPGLQDLEPDRPLAGRRSDHEPHLDAGSRSARRGGHREGRVAAARRDDRVVRRELRSATGRRAADVLEHAHHAGALHAWRRPGRGRGAEHLPGLHGRHDARGGRSSRHW